MDQIPLAWLLVVSLVLPTQALQACYIENIKSVPAATSVTITWETSRECDKSNIVRYEVFWEHVKFLACVERRNDTDAYGSKEVIVTKVQVGDLHPFSLYDVTIKTTTHDGSKIKQATSTFETEMDVPDIKPRPSTKNERYQQAINFVWEDFEGSDCISQNGRKDGYVVELIGLDPWQQDKIEIENNRTIVSYYYAENLHPYTSYRLNVYNRNIGGLVNYAKALEIQERTRETEPEPPTNLTAKAISQQSVHISWNPSYPPTGLIEKYDIFVGEIYDSESINPVWKKTVTVSLAHQGACIGEKKRRSTTLSNPFCYVLNGLQGGIRYAFKIKAWNKNVEQPSIWSEITDVWTDTPDIITPTVTPTSRILEPTTSQPNPGFSNITIIVVLCLSGGIVLMGVCVTAMVYKLKIIRLKQQIRNEETWNQNRSVSQSSSYLPGASTSTQMTETYLASLHSNTPSEIQRRRLPEPPPVRNRVDTADPSYAVPKYAETYELTTHPVPYLDMTQSRRTSASPSQFESTRIEEEDCTDIDGYLKPTFPNPDFTPIKQKYNDRHRNSSQTDSDYVSESQEAPSLITPESYVAPETIRNEMQPSYLITDSRLLSGQFECDRISPGRRSQNSMHFDRAGRLSSQRSETSGTSSKRNSPSEPLISISKAVDV